jgi:hypothetical protein
MEYHESLFSGSEQLRDERQMLTWIIEAITHASFVLQ